MALVGTHFQLSVEWGSLCHWRNQQRSLQASCAAASHRQPRQTRQRCLQTNHNSTRLVIHAAEKNAFYLLDAKLITGQTVDDHTGNYRVIEIEQSIDVNFRESDTP